MTPAVQAPEMVAALTRRELALRSVWIVVRLLAGYCLAKQVSPFFYQQF